MTSPNIEDIRKHNPEFFSLAYRGETYHIEGNILEVTTPFGAIPQYIIHDDLTLGFKGYK